MKVNSVKYKIFLKLLYALCYVRILQGDEKVFLVKESIASYLSVSRMQVHRWIDELERDGVLYGKIRSRKGNSDKAKSQWAFCGYSVDLAKLEALLTRFDIKIEPYERQRSLLADYCICSHRFSKIKKEHPEATKEEIASMMTSVAVIEAEKEEKYFDRLCKKHKYFLDKLDDLNRYYGGRFHWSYLKEHKKRMTNALCTTKNPEKHEDSTRYDMIKSILGSRQVTEFDVKSSIYNVSYGLGQLVMAPLDTDFYKKVFIEAGIDNLPCTAARWKAVRPYVKQIFMPIYMKPGALKRRCMNYEYLKEHGTEHLNEQDLKMYELHTILCKMFNSDLETILMKLRDAMHRVLGLDKFYGKDIFYYESDLHILVLWHLLFDYGIEVVNVYDGFYYLSEIKDFEKIFEKVYFDSFKELLTVTCEPRRKAS